MSLQDEINDEVDDIIEENNIVIFMKGNQLAPQCKYSETALNLIRKYTSDYKAVDVLNNTDEYRNALERKSDWVTIPQVYVEQDFIGGCDIIEELDEKDELENKLDL